MAFVSISNIADNAKGNSGCKRGRGYSTRSYLVVGCCSGGKDKRGLPRKAIVVRLSRELAREARILSGDRVDLLFDKDAGLGLIRRVSKGGYAATATGKKQTEIKEGEFYSITMKSTYYAGMPLFPQYDECENVTISDEGILFSIPKTATYEKEGK